MHRLFRAVTSLMEPTIQSKPYFLTRVLLSQDKPQSKLALLRKKTGLPIIKCKEALTRFSELEEAESWLEMEARKEGMQRVSLGRDTSNGVVALNILRRDSLLRTAMVELNCETDHLSLSEEFRLLASNICLSIARSAEPVGVVSVERVLSADQEKGLSILDSISSFVGRAKESTIVKRAVVYEGRGNCLIGSYVHNALDFSYPDSILKVGTHAAFVELEGESSEAHLLADRMAQHVVGMPQEGKENIETLLEQPWLFDLDKTVNSVLETSQLKCVHFVRYEVGK